MFIQNKDYINNHVLLLFIKNIINNNNDFINKTKLSINHLFAKSLYNIDKLNFFTKNYIENPTTDENLIIKSFENILNEKLSSEIFDFNFNLENKVKLLNTEKDYEEFFNKITNKIMIKILENIFYTMCFVNDDLFKQFKEENLFKFFIDNYQSVFKYPIDDNKMSYNNMLTNIKNINNDLILNNPSLNILDRLNYFKEILNDFKYVKSKKIKNI